MKAALFCFPAKTPHIFPMGFPRILRAQWTSVRALTHAVWQEIGEMAVKRGQASLACSLLYSLPNKSSNF